MNSNLQHLFNEGKLATKICKGLTVFLGLGLDAVTLAGTAAKQPVGSDDENGMAVAAPRKDKQLAERNIVEDVAAFIRRFVFFREDALYHLVSAWVITTYLTELFEYSGYLFAHSPEPQSGKSRLLEVLDLLVSNSSGILVSPTEAVLFRTAEGGTQLLDEVDSWGNTEALRSVLNAGFRLGGAVPRMVEAKEGYEPKQFSVYGPRALAGIGTRILNPATLDRTFMLAMFRQTKGERREKLRIRKIKPEANLVKERISLWAKNHKESVASTYDKSQFPYLEDFSDRTIDIAEPIATIIDVAYDFSPAIRTARCRLADALELSRREERPIKEHHKVLRQLLQIAENHELVGSVTELSEMCKAGNIIDPASPGMISEALRQYDFRMRSRRKDGGQPAYRYVLPKAKLTEVLDRYAGSDLPDPEIEDEAVPVEVVELATPVEAAEELNHSQ